MENKDIIRIVVLPEFGDAYRIELYVPNDRDTEQFIDEWLDDHTINVQAWEFDD